MAGSKQFSTNSTSVWRKTYFEGKFLFAFLIILAAKEALDYKQTATNVTTDNQFSQVVFSASVSRLSRSWKRRFRTNFHDNLLVSCRECKLRFQLPTLFDTLEGKWIVLTFFVAYRHVVLVGQFAKMAFVYKSTVWILSPHISYF